MSPILRTGTRSISARPGAALRTTSTPLLRSACRSASARLALVAMSPNSMPSATIVCAICGRMPEMMHSAPISRAATTVLSRCWATWVSTAGTPVMSMMAYGGAGVDQGLQQLLHDHLGAGRVERADQRHRDHALPQLDHRRGELEQLLGLLGDELLAGAGVALEGEQAQLVDPARRGDQCGGGLLRLHGHLEQRILQREHAHGRLAGGEAAPGTVARQLGQQRPDLAVALVVEIQSRDRDRLRQRGDQVAEGALQLGGRGLALQLHRGRLHPALQQRAFVVPQQAQQMLPLVVGHAQPPVQRDRVHTARAPRHLSGGPGHPFRWSATLSPCGRLRWRPAPET